MGDDEDFADFFELEKLIVDSVEDTGWN